MSQTIAGYPFIAVKNVNIGWVLENVLTKNECDFIIKNSERHLKPSTIIFILPYIIIKLRILWEYRLGQ